MTVDTLPLLAYFLGLPNLKRIKVTTHLIHEWDQSFPAPEVRDGLYAQLIAELHGSRPHTVQILTTLHKWFKSGMAYNDFFSLFQILSNIKGSHFTLVKKCHLE